MSIPKHQQIANTDGYIQIAANLCFALSMLILTLSADSLGPVPPAETAERQNLLIHKALDGRPLRLESDREYPESLPNSNVCTWKEIGCVDGVVKSVCAKENRKYAHTQPSGLNTISVEWLPPTTEFIHFCIIEIPNLWKFMALPRDLKYMCLWLCSFRDTKNIRADFARLPHNMEELILMNSVPSGVLQLAILPKTMRLVCIQVFAGRLFTTGIVVDYNSLPEALEVLHVATQLMGKVETVPVGKPRGVKLRKEFSEKILQKESHFFEMWRSK